MSRQTRGATHRAQSAARGAWHELPEDLVCRVAGLLPIRERYGVLPMLSCHYRAISLRWPIGEGMGITQLFLPSGRLSSEAIVRRCAGVRAWLASHRQQLRGLRCDLQPDFFHPRRNSAQARAAALRPAQAAIAAALWEHRTALASLLLGDKHMDDVLKAATGCADPASGLAQCTALSSLVVWDYDGTATKLAAMLAPLASLSHLELALKRSIPSLLLSRPPPLALTSALRVLALNSDYFAPGLSDADLNMRGFAACTGLTRLDLTLQGSAITPDMEHCLGQLSNLAELWLGAPWSSVPAVLASLPLTKLSLSRLEASDDSLQQRLAGGLPQEFTRLAPTLQDLHIEARYLSMLPVACSMLTRLTALTCITIGEMLRISLPPWLSRLTNLRRLECQSYEYGHVIVNANLTLPSLESLELGVRSLNHATKLFPQLTRLALGFEFNAVIDLQDLQGATRLRELKLEVDAESSEAELRNVQALNELAALTGLSLLYISDAVQPPEGDYLSRLVAIKLHGYNKVSLPQGLTAATCLTHLVLDNYHMSLSALWEPLQQLLPCCPQLEELEILEESEDDEPQRILVGDLLQHMS